MLQVQQGLFTKLYKSRNGGVETSFVISHKPTVSHSETKEAFDNVPLSRWTVTSLIEDFMGNVEWKITLFTLFILGCDTVQLLVFALGITEFGIMEELAAMHGMKGTKIWQEK